MFLPHGQGHLPQPPPNFTNEVTPRAAGRKTARRRRPAGHEREPHGLDLDQQGRPPTMMRERDRTVPRFHVKHRELLAILLLCLTSVVLMTFLLLLLTNGLLNFATSSPDEHAQVPHFVCTADGDGTILRCVFSSIAKPPL